MYVVTLISSPKSRALDPVLVTNLRNAWGGGDVIWLAPNEAAEFEIMETPSNFPDIWHDLQLLSVDLVLQPATGRKKKILIADMDSTMIRQECIDELADFVGVGVQVAKITVRAMAGEIGFKESLQDRVSLLKGFEATAIQTVLENRITFTSGGQTLIATMKRHGAYCALISGGFTDFACSVADTLGFDEFQANTLHCEAGIFTGEVAEPILGRDAKVNALNEIAQRLGYSADQALAVGDGANDLGMLLQAGAGVAFHANPAVAEQCKIRVNHGDLTSLLYLQGYRQVEFAD